MKQRARKVSPTICSSIAELGSRFSQFLRLHFMWTAYMQECQNSRLHTQGSNKKGPFSNRTAFRLSDYYIWQVCMYVCQSVSQSVTHFKLCDWSTRLIWLSSLHGALWWTNRCYKMSYIGSNCRNYLYYV